MRKAGPRPAVLIVLAILLSKIAHHFLKLGDKKLAFLSRSLFLIVVANALRTFAHNFVVLTNKKSPKAFLAVRTSSLWS